MENATKESFKIDGENLLKKVKELIQEGNIRKITIHGSDGKELMSFPLTIGVVGAVFAPVLAAIGALAALIEIAPLQWKENLPANKRKGNSG